MPGLTASCQTAAPMTLSVSNSRYAALNCRHHFQRQTLTRQLTNPGKVLPAGAKFCAAATAQAKAGGASKTTASAGPAATGNTTGSVTSAPATTKAAATSTTATTGAAATAGSVGVLGLLVAGMVAAL